MARVSHDFSTKKESMFFGKDNVANAHIAFSIRAIREYINADGEIFYFLAGSQTVPSDPCNNSTWFLMLLDQDLQFFDSISIPIPGQTACTTGLNLIKGEIQGMCLGYPGGSNPGGKPVIPGDEPNRILLTGYYNSQVSCSTIIDQDAYLISISFSDFFDNATDGNGGTLVCANVEDFKAFDSEDHTHASDPNVYEGFFKDDELGFDFPNSKWPCSTQTCIKTWPGTDNAHAIRDWAKSVEQDDEGDFVMSIMANYSRLGDGNNGYPSIIVDYQRDSRNPSDLYSCQVVLMALSQNTTTMTLLDEKVTEHIGHASGMDFLCKARFDHDGSIYVFTSIADDNKALQLESPGTGDYVANFILFKIKLTKGGSWDFERYWYKVMLGGKGGTSDQQGRGCGFDCAITRNNEIIGVGDNQNDFLYRKDNYELILISDDCMANTIISTPYIDRDNGLDEYWIHSIDLEDQYEVGPNTPNDDIVIWNTSKIVKASIFVESGKTLIIDGATVEFLDISNLDDGAKQRGVHSGIVVEGGGKLIVKNNGLLTSYQGACSDKWDGVLLGYTGYPYAEMVLDNSKIENAHVGVDIWWGSFDGFNNDPCFGLPYDYVDRENFVNNNIGVRYNSGYAQFIGHLSRFKLLNFVSDQVFYRNGGGFNCFVKNEAVPGLVFRGCSFLNTHLTMPGLCAGIVSTEAAFDVIPAPLKYDDGGGCAYTNDIPCDPTSSLEFRPCEFRGLWTGIHNGGSVDEGLRMRILDAKFTNCREAIIDAVSRESFIYRNKIDWDNSSSPLPDFTDYAFAGIKYGIFNTWAYGADVLQNEITNYDVDNDFLGIYSEQVAWDGGYGGYRVFKNTITNDDGDDPRGIAQKTAGDNDYLQIGCNTYLNLYQDWLINDDLATQGQTGPNKHNSNTWSTGGCGIGAGGYRHIDGDASFIFNNPPSGGYKASCVNEGPVYIFSEPDAMSCPDLEPCEVYSAESELTYGDDEEIWEVVALRIKNPIQEVTDYIYGGEYSNARQTLARLIWTDEKLTNMYDGLIDYFNIIIPAFEQNRRYSLTGDEISALRDIAKGNNYTARKAENFLFFYAGIRLPRESQTKKANRSRDSQLKTNDLLHTKLITVYPNPADDFIKISSLSNEPMDIVISDMKGLIIMTSENVTNHSQLNVKHLTKGIYVVRVFQKQQLVLTEKLLR